MSIAILALMFGAQPLVHATPVSTTTVQGTVYRADGSIAAGTVIVSWPAFSTALGQSVAAGTVTATIAADGSVTLNLAPNSGALPAGTYYTAIYHLSDGTVSREYWLVPAATTASIASIRAQLASVSTAGQPVSKQYVDNAIAGIGSGSGSSSSVALAGGTMTGPLLLSGDPVSANQAATKHYADVLSASAVALAGGSMTGPLNLVANPTSASLDLQAATAGLVRAVAPRSVLEFGAVCDGVTNDQPAFQSAFNWALTNNSGVSFPAKTCFLASPVIWNGQPMQGQGRSATFIKQNAGYDVFESADASTGGVNFVSGGHVSDFTVLMDNTVDSSQNGNGRYNRPAGFNTVFAPNQVGYITSALPAFQVGACAFAVPSYGFPSAGAPNATVFERVQIYTPAGTNRVGATCGFWFQSLPYGVVWHDVYIAQTEYGIIEALPNDKTTWAAYLSSLGTSSDTNMFDDVNVTTAVGIEILLGNHNNFKGTHIYARGKYQSPGCTDGHSAAIILDNAGLSGVQNNSFDSTYVEPGCLKTGATLTAAIGTTDTTVALSDIRQLTPTGSTVYLETQYGPNPGEWVNYTGITAGVSPAGTLTGVTRGAMGTTAIAHATGEFVSNAAEYINGTRLTFTSGNLKQGLDGIVVIPASDSSFRGIGVVNSAQPFSLQVMGNKDDLDMFDLTPYDVLDLGTGNKIASPTDNGSTNQYTPKIYVNAAARPLLANKLMPDWLSTGGPFYQSLDDLLFTPDRMTTVGGIGGSFGSGVPLSVDVTAPVSQRYVYVPSGTTINGQRFNGIYQYLVFGRILPLGKVNLNLYVKGDAATTITATVSGQSGVCSVTTSWSLCTLPMDFTSQTAGTTTELDISPAPAGIKYSAVAFVPVSSATSTASLAQHIAHVCIEDYLTGAMAGDYAQAYNAAVQAQSLTSPTEVRACSPGNHTWGSGGAGGVADRPIITDFSGSTMVLASGLASTPVTVSGTVTAGSLTVAVASTTGLVAGQHIGGTGLLPDTMVASVNSGASTITLTQYPLLSVNGFTSTSNAVTNLSSVGGLAVGQTIVGSGIPAATTIATLDTSGYGMTLSAPTTATNANGQALTVTAGSWTVPLTAVTVKKALRYTYNAAAEHNYQGQMIGGEIRNIWFTDPGYRSLKGVAGLQIDAWDTLPINHLRIDNIAGSELIIGGSDGANVVRESDFWGLQLRDGGEPMTGQASLVINTPPGTVGSDENNNLRFDGHVVFPYYLGEYIGTANLNHTGTNGPRLIYHTANFQLEGGGRLLQNDGTYANVYIAKPYDLVQINLAGDVFYQGGAMNIPGLGKSIFRVDTARYLGATGGRLEPIANGSFLFNVTVTAGSPTVTYVSYPASASVKSFDFNAGGTLREGTRVLIGSSTYIVQSVAAAGGSLTLTSNYSGATGSTTMTQTDGGFYLNVTNSLITAQTSGYYNDFSVPGLGLAGLPNASYPALFQGLSNITSGYGFEDYQGRDKRGEGLDVVADSGGLPGLSVGSGANNASFIGIGGSYALADWRYFAGFGGGQAIMQASYQKNLCLMLSSPSNTFAVGTCVLQLTNTTNAVTTPQTTLDDGSGNSIFSKTTAASFATSTNCASGLSPAVCGSAAAGAAIVPPGVTTQTVNTTAIGANSQVIVQQDNALGTRLGVTCYTGGNTNPYISARVAGTSFTFTVGAPTTNPGCYSYIIMNK
ncbi:MAG TPA: hypothetical protein VGD59_01770 [Acidisarcina sp.]